MSSAKVAPSKGLPSASELVPYAYGAAGHEGVSSNASGSLLIKPCTQAEITFYESAQDHPNFQTHMPVFMGSLRLNEDPKMKELVGAATSSKPSDADTAPKTKDGAQEGRKEWVPSGGKQITTGLAIVLENISAGFKHPCVLDLKLGARLWDDDAPEAKRQKLDQVAKETTTGSLGFRVAGMKVWQGESNPNTIDVNTEVKDGYKSFDKLYGRNLTESNVSEAFVHVIGGSTNVDGKANFKRRRAVELLERFLEEVKSIRELLETEESRMYSASILLVLEGDDAALEAGREKEETKKTLEEDDEDAEDEEDEDMELGPKVLEVRLIDFAHARWSPGEGPDENSLTGVRNIQKILEDLLKSAR